MKKKIFTLLVLFVLSTMLVSTLYLVSKKLNHGKNGFTRVFTKKNPAIFRQLDLKYNSYYLSGLAENNIYLANFTAPASLLQINLDNFERTTHVIKINKDYPTIAQPFKTVVDSPLLFLIDGQARIFKTDFKESTFNIWPYSKLSFMNSTPISPNSLILKKFNRERNQTELVKESSAPPYISENQWILEKQNEGIFSVDGMLNYNKKNGMLVYTYYYRNRLTAFDTNLSVIYREKTIDTNRHAKITSTYVKSEKAYRFSKPSFVVNKKSCVSNNYVFIVSDVKADNENEKDFAGNSVVDVYGLKTGKYNFSFYLPGKDEGGTEEIMANENFLFVTRDHFLIIYKLPF